MGSCCETGAVTPKEVPQWVHLRCLHTRQSQEGKPKRIGMGTTWPTSGETSSSSQLHTLGES